MIRRLAAATVWAPQGVAAEDWRYRGIVRFVIPATDASVLYFAVVSLMTAIPGLGMFIGPESAALWCFGVAVTAGLSLLGVSFPKLWGVEIAGRVLWVSLITGYLWLYLPYFTDLQVTASVVLNLTLIYLPVWRIGDLGFEAWKRGHTGEVDIVTAGEIISLVIACSALLGLLLTFITNKRANSTSEKKLTIEEQTAKDTRTDNIAERRLGELERLYPRMEQLEQDVAVLRERDAENRRIIDGQRQTQGEMIRHIVALERLVPNPPGPPTRPDWA